MVIELLQLKIHKAVHSVKDKVPEGSSLSAAANMLTQCSEVHHSKIYLKYSRRADKNTFLALVCMRADVFPTAICMTESHDRIQDFILGRACDDMGCFSGHA